ncbi:MAG: cyclic nucleotide-binding domain-containing protein [Candidatus Latescibacteria bacterium]|nr:cyclic nucleotide-binding domain-containing protein [Candidatus Latescibacterota bacterium]
MLTALRPLISSLFRVQPGEGVRVALMMFYSISAVGGIIITGQTVSSALFLSAVPPAVVPYKFILPPLVLMVTSALYARLAPRFRRDRFILVCYGLMLAGVGVFRLLLATSYHQDFVLLCALFVFFEVIGDLVMLQFWTLAQDLFNAREARRLFGLIGGSAISNILFGALLGSIATAVAPRNLIFIIMGSLVSCIVCVYLLGHKFRYLLIPEEQAPTDSDDKAQSQSVLQDLRQVINTPLLVSMGGVVILIGMATQIANYQLDLSLQTTYGDDSQSMVAFLGNFRLWAGIAALFLQFLVAGRLLERFGVAAALLLLPAFMGLGSGAILVAGGVLWATVIPRACDLVLKYTLNDAALNLLYLPVEGRLRTKAKAILDGMVRSPIASLLGLVFLLGSPSGKATIVAWSLPLLIVALLWMVLVVRASRQYVQALAQSVQLRRFDPDQERVDLTDESSLRVLRQALQSDDTMRVIHALDLLPRLSSIDWRGDVMALLDHPSPEVRVQALQYLGRQEIALDQAVLKRTLDDADQQVQGAAVELLCAQEGPQAIHRVLPYLEDPVPAIRSAAVLGLMKHTGLDGLLHAVEHLKALLDSPQANARLEGVRVLEVLQVPSFYHPLIRLLQDDSTEVQIGTMRAAAKIQAPELVPYLVPKLDSPLTRWYATEAIARCIGEDLSPLGALLQDGRQPLAVRQQIAVILQQHPCDQTVQALLSQLENPSDPLRATIYAALLELRQGPYPLLVDPDRLHQALQTEFHCVYTLYIILADLKVEDRDLLLAEAFQLRIRQAKQRVFALLDLSYTDISIDWLNDTLDQDDPRMRAAAVELIDNLVDRATWAYLQPLIGPVDTEAVLAIARQLDLQSQPASDRLESLCQSADPWLQCCALYTIGRRHLTHLAPILDQAEQCKDPLVRETAEFARRDLAELVPPHRRQGDQNRPMALSTLEKVFFLKSAPLFEQIPAEDTVDITTIVHEIDISQGEIFIRRGEEGNCLYIIVEGEVLISREDGSQDISGTREVIGERAVLTEQPRNADCTARTDVVALRIDKKAFWKLMNEQPQITIEVMKVLVDRYL